MDSEEKFYIRTSTGAYWQKPGYGTTYKKKNAYKWTEKQLHDHGESFGINAVKTSLVDPPESIDNFTLL